MLAPLTKHFETHDGENQNIDGNEGTPVDQPVPGSDENAEPDNSISSGVILHNSKEDISTNESESFTSDEDFRNNIINKSTGEDSMGYTSTGQQSFSSQSSSGDTYPLNLSSDIYQQSDSDWPIREALLFRLVNNLVLI